MSGFERSHGKPRVPLHRVSDMGDGATLEQPPSSRVEQLRQNATNHPAKTASRRFLKAIVEAGVDDAMPESATAAESRLVAETALQLAAGAARHVNASNPFVAHHATRYGVNAALAGFYTQKAAEAGFASKLGLELVDAAQRCEQQATRAMAAIDAALKAFGNKRRAAGALDATPWLEPADQEPKP
jgi:hypothetical protein